MKRFFFLVVLVFTLSQFAWSTTYYVNKSGNDANSCTTAQSSTPANGKLTITAAVLCLAAGDTLIIGAGTYTENTNWGASVPPGISDNQHTIVKGAAAKTVILNGVNSDGTVLG